VELSERLARSDQEAKLALRELYDRLSPKLFASLKTRRVSPADAAEIVQEAFLKTWASRQSLPQGVNLDAYVWCTARNTWIDRYRNQKRRDEEAALTAEDETPLGQVETPERAVFVSCLEKAFEAYRQGEPERAHAIELVAVQGFDHNQLSEALGKSRGAAREFLSQARNAFERLYQQLCGDAA